MPRDYTEPTEAMLEEITDLIDERIKDMKRSDAIAFLGDILTHCEVSHDAIKEELESKGEG